MRLFGFSIGSKDVVQAQKPEQRSFALPNEALDDGAVTIQSNAHYGTYVDLEGSVRNELELISRYREMANHPELEMAIEEIINEAINFDDTGRVLKLNLDKLQQSDIVKRKILDEFDAIQRMLNFNNLAHDIFKRWYIDGRIYFHVVVDEKNPKLGIQELRYIDPRKIRKVREIQKERDASTGAMVIKSMAEYYVFNDRGTTTQTYSASVNTGIRIAPDSIVNVNSGMMDAKGTFVISYLHQCIRGDQRVKTVNGWKYMKDIVPGDEIYSYDVDNEKMIQTKVVDAWSNGKKETLTVKTRHSQLVCTPDHLILTKNKKTDKIKYIRADEVSDYLVRLEANFENVVDIIPNENLEEVFDLEVDNEHHNFIVNGIVVHNCIKALNQLRMIEDAIVIYRLSRAPERRIFYIDVGNLPKGKAEQYLKDVMVKYRNKMVYDAQSGELRNDTKHLCLAMDTKIPLLDGRVLTLAEITEEFEQGKKLWAYSCDPVTGKFSPGPITWAGVTRRNSEMMRLTLDNGESIVCTPEHSFPTWNNGLVQAQNLAVGESMIPFYIKESQINPKYGNGGLYLQLYDNQKKNWKFVHRLVSKWKDSVGMENEWTYKVDGEKRTVHHRDFNKNNNTPENLVRMNNSDHSHYHSNCMTPEEKTLRGKKGGAIGGKLAYEMGVGIHALSTEERVEIGKKAGAIGGKRSAELGRSQENYALGREKLKELMVDPVWNAEFRQKQSEGWTEEKRQVASEHSKNNNLSARGNAKKQELFKTPEHLEQFRKKYKTEYTEEMFSLLAEFTRQGMSIEKISININEKADTDAWRELNSDKVGSQKDWSKFIKSDVERMVKDLGFNKISEYRDSLQYRNHKIAKIEYLDERMDSGCLTIDGDEKYHKNHTFALDCGIYCKNSMLEDFWLPRREGGKGTEITTLPAGCLAMDTKVSLLDGRELTIKEIETEIESGKTLWTYSCHPTTGEIVPGLITWAGVTQKSAKVLKLTLDNGQSIVATPDHKFPIYNEGFVRADELFTGQYLIPFHCDQKQLVNIEYLDNPIEVGTLTIDGQEKYHDYHTFALSCGVFTKNSNLGELEDVKYFRQKLLQSLKVPISRLEPQDGGMIGMGRVSEVTRDEVKFSKFIQKLRNKFAQVFDRALEKQLVLKGICTKEEWKEFREYIYYDFVKDNNFTEMRDLELTRERLNLLMQIDQYTGTYYSRQWIRKNILHQDEDLINEMTKQMLAEQEMGDAGPVGAQMGQQQESVGPDNTQENNTVDDSEQESLTPMLDAEVNKYSSYMSKKGQ